MLNKIMLIMIMLSSSVAYGMDELSSLPESHEKLLTQIQSTLKINKLSQETKSAIYSKFSWALNDDWYSYWVGNSDLNKSKFVDNPVQIYELIIHNKKGVNIVTFTYFPDAKQIFYSSKQFIETSSATALEAFKKQKAKENVKLLSEKDNFGFSKRKGYVEFVSHHIKSPNGLVSYIDYGLIDVK